MKARTDIGGPETDHDDAQRLPDRGGPFTRGAAAHHSSARVITLGGCAKGQDDGPFQGRLRDGAPRRPDWPVSSEHAISEQERLRKLVNVSVPGPDLADGALVAGVDVAYDDGRDRVVAAAVVLDSTDLTVVEQATAAGHVSFPYVPGLLAFRELPAVLDALGALRHTPQLIVSDGYGIAHPRRLGLASHLGVLTGIPTFGVAKTPFLYGFQAPGPERGDASPLLDGTEEVGRALRTRAAVKPVFVSAGHLIDLDHACAHTLALAPRYRLPETTRRADHLCRHALAGRPARLIR